MNALRFALIGHPVAHSLSPFLHGAAYSAMGLPHRYELVDCADESSVRREIEALRSGTSAGINVTVPWKRIALSLADRADGVASEIEAANVLARESDGSISASNTDVPALAEELAQGSQRLYRAAIIGSGGAARAAVAACRALGAREIGVVARRFTGDEASWPDVALLKALGATPIGWPSGSPPEGRRPQTRPSGSPPEGRRPQTRPSVAGSEWERFVSDADVVVQATSAGMHGADPGEVVRDLVPWPRLPKTAFAYDVVYAPSVTPFVAAARGAGLSAASGLGMLVAQAALGFERWLGIAPPRAAMRAAAEAELSKREKAA